MQRVVVIGGGFAGVAVSRTLRARFDVTLVDTKDYFEFTPGILRSLVDPSHLRRIQVCHSRAVRGVRVAVGKATGVAERSVTLSDGSSLAYDYLVLATGSRYSPPIKDPSVVMASRAADLAAHARRVAEAGSVLIVGGGLAGVELAAEIAVAYPGKEVSIVDVGPQLLGRLGSRARDYATKFLRRHGVALSFGQRIVGREGGVYVTDSGGRLAADVAFMCTGVVPNGELPGAAFPGCLNEQGFVHVLPTLQLPGHPNVFVVGDANDCGVEKTAQNARRQAAVAAANIVALSAEEPLRDYRPAATPMVISLGPRDGIFASGGRTVTGWLPAAMKWGVERQVVLTYRWL